MAVYISLEFWVNSAPVVGAEIKISQNFSCNLVVYFDGIDRGWRGYYIKGSITIYVKPNGQAKTFL